MTILIPIDGQAGRWQSREKLGRAESWSVCVCVGVIWLLYIVELLVSNADVLWASPSELGRD